MDIIIASELKNVGYKFRINFVVIFLYPSIGAVAWHSILSRY